MTQQQFKPDFESTYTTWTTRFFNSIETGKENFSLAEEQQLVEALSTSTFLSEQHKLDALTKQLNAPLRVLLKNWERLHAQWYELYTAGFGLPPAVTFFVKAYPSYKESLTRLLTRMNTDISLLKLQEWNERGYQPAVEFFMCMIQYMVHELNILDYSTESEES